MTSVNPQLLQCARHDVYPFIDPQTGLQDAASGKTILITGAGTGIGRAIARAFALAGAGQVILAARRGEPLQETKRLILQDVNETCNVIIRDGIDISSLDSVKALFDGLDCVPNVLIQNAALSAITDTVVNTSPLQWSNEIDINIKGTFHVCQTYLLALRQQPESLRKQARIVNISSNVFWKNIPGRSSYAASKIATNSLTEYIDNECLADPALYGVRCVAMHPGGVAGTELSSTVSPEIRRFLIDRPELAGGTAVYLSSDRADFLMGRFVNATWDMEQLERERSKIEDSDWLRTRVLGVH